MRLPSLAKSATMHASGALLALATLIKRDQVDLVLGSTQPAALMGSHGQRQARLNMNLSGLLMHVGRTCLPGQICPESHVHQQLACNPWALRGPPFPHPYHPRINIS